MTESEAKTKWCPFARVAHRDNPTGGNRYYYDTAGDKVYDVTRCIASECMAWRQHQYKEGSAHYGEGFCGLAGK